MKIDSSPPYPGVFVYQRHSGKDCRFDEGLGNVVRDSRDQGQTRNLVFTNRGKGSYGHQLRKDVGTEEE